MQASKVVNTAVNTLRAEMKISGIHSEPGSPEEKQQAQIESGLRDQLIAAQQAKNGAPLTTEEAQNIAMGYFADHVLNGKGGLGRDGGEQKPVTSQPRPHASNAQESGNQSPVVVGGAYAMPAGGVVATSTGGGQRAQDAKTATGNLAVGDKKPHGVIAEGSEPGSRVYVVKTRWKGGAVDLNTICAETGYDYDQLKALNNIDHDGVWSISNGEKILLPQQSPEVKNDTGHTPVIDIGKATTTLNANAQGEPKHRCSHYVFLAINAGLPADKQVAGPGLAKNAEKDLLSIGFTKVLTSSDQLATYTPKKGDVVVLQDYPGQKAHAGHIAMFDGKHWVSDYAQKGTSRIWAGEKFESAKVGMVVYRP